jgi:probable phosphoglycerate mutase
MKPPSVPASPLSERAKLIAHIDGGSRGNPGPAGFGVVIQDAGGRVLETLSEAIGIATNNVAEYRALLAALHYALARRVAQLQIYCDSELVVRQMQGRYRVQSADLKPLFLEAQRLVQSFEKFSIEHVRRESNADADRLANEAMDRFQGSTASASLPSFVAVLEKGKLRPLSPPVGLEEGAEYEVRLKKRSAKPEALSHYPDKSGTAL